LVPLALFLLLFRRTLRGFLEAQVQAARDERLKLLGEAANLIAHEIKNSLNGLQVGLELVARPERSDRTLAAMRTEISRLSGFTSKLLSFSKGVTPRPAPMDLGAFTRKLATLFEELVTEAGVTLDLDVAEEPVLVRADASLVHVVVSNL